MTQEYGAVAATLKRLLQAPAARECCELCGAGLAGEHAHVIDTHARRLLCACATCGAIDAGATERRYRPVSTRYQAGPVFSSSGWDRLGIPVDLAFLFYSTPLDRMVACYPGPLGTTESVVPLDAWPSLVEEHPVLRTMAADVEGLVVRRSDRDYPSFIVPIDACYELAGRVRLRWSGFSGGDEVRAEIDRFFARVLERCGPGQGSPDHAAGARS